MTNQMEDCSITIIVVARRCCSPADGYRPKSSQQPSMSFPRLLRSRFRTGDGRAEKAFGGKFGLPRVACRHPHRSEFLGRKMPSRERSEMEMRHCQGGSYSILSFLFHMLTIRAPSSRTMATAAAAMRWLPFLIAALLYVSTVVDNDSHNFLPSVLPQVHALTTSSSVAQLSSRRLVSRHPNGRSRHRGGLLLSRTDILPTAKSTMTRLTPHLHRRTKRQLTTTSMALSNESTSSKTTKSTSLSSNKLKNFIVYCLSGRRELLQRPNYASTAFQYMPTWLFTLRPITQCVLCFLLYIFHTGILTQNSIVFPIQLLPNNKGHFQSIGYDS